MYRIYFPWGRGIGTLGLWLGTLYADFTIVTRGLQMFVSRETNGRYGSHCSTTRSWYRLRWYGWQLVKREDHWGTYTNGKRRPPLYSQPMQGIPNRAWELRKHFKPYQLIDWYGVQQEVISFPSPERSSATVMMRSPNDPTTIHEVVLEEYV